MSSSDARKQRLQQQVQEAKERLGGCYRADCQPMTFGDLSHKDLEQTSSDQLRVPLDVLAPLGEEDFPDFLWQVMLGVCGLISDLAVGNPPSNVGLLTTEFEKRAWPVLVKLGCRGFRVWQSNRQSIESIEQACRLHDWPLAVWGRLTSARWAQVDARCIITHQNRWNALCRRLEGNWYVVPAEAPIECPQDQIRALQQLLASWLLQLEELDYVPRRSGPLGVVESLRMLLVENRVPTVSLERAARGMQWPVPSGDPAALAEMLHLLMCNEKLGILPGDGCSLDTELRYIKTKSRKRLLIPVAAIERLLAERHAAWNRVRVIETLQKHRLLRGQRNGYWAVPAHWWRGTAGMKSAPFVGVRI